MQGLCDYVTVSIFGEFETYHADWNIICLLPLFIISHGIVTGLPSLTLISLPLLTMRGVGKVPRFKKYFWIWSDPTWDNPEKEKNICQCTDFVHIIHSRSGNNCYLSRRNQFHLQIETIYFYLSQCLFFFYICDTFKNSIIYSGFQYYTSCTSGYIQWSYHHSWWNPSTLLSRGSTIWSYFGISLH